MAGIDRKDHFVAELKRQRWPSARYALARWDSASGYNMSGHFHSGFYGIRAFFRAHPRYQGQFHRIRWTRSFWKNHARLERDFRAFVLANYARFPGQKGGDWRKKLPPRLGGTQTNGGAGSGLISRLFILLDRYGRRFGY
jgi:hypothetical protein